MGDTETELVPDISRDGLRSEMDIELDKLRSSEELTVLLWGSADNESEDVFLVRDSGAVRDVFVFVMVSSLVPVAVRDRPS